MPLFCVDHSKNMNEKLAAGDQSLQCNNDKEILHYKQKLSQHPMIGYEHPISVVLAHLDCIEMCSNLSYKNPEKLRSCTKL